jgi:hypothetical protein
LVVHLVLARLAVLGASGALGVLGIGEKSRSAFILLDAFAVLQEGVLLALNALSIRLAL